MTPKEDEFIDNMPCPSWIDGLSNGVEKARNCLKAKRHTPMWTIPENKLKTHLWVAVYAEEMKVLKNMVISVATLLSERFKHA